jgi:hypothetical protein
VFEFETEAFGTVAMVAIGASDVGTVQPLVKPGQAVTKVWGWGHEGAGCRAGACRLCPSGAKPPRPRSTCVCHHPPHAPPPRPPRLPQGQEVAVFEFGGSIMATVFPVRGGGGGGRGGPGVGAAPGAAPRSPPRRAPAGPRCRPDPHAQPACPAAPRRPLPFQPGSIAFDADLVERSGRRCETRVNLGSGLGRAARGGAGPPAGAARSSGGGAAE